MRYEKCRPEDRELLERTWNALVAIQDACDLADLAGIPFSSYSASRIATVRQLHYLQKGRLWCWCEFCGVVPGVSRET